MADDPTHGLACPRCGYRLFRTTHTRRHGNRVKRRRVCRRCNKPSVSWEAFAVDLAKKATPIPTSANPTP